MDAFPARQPSEAPAIIAAVLDTASFEAAASIATAVGTLVLAVVTYLMVRKTGAMAEATNSAASAGMDEANATHELVLLERLQMQNAGLPVVMPIIGSVEVGTSPATGTVQVFIPVQNIGVGPALALRLTLEFLDQHGTQASRAVRIRSRSSERGLQPGMNTPLDCSFTA